MLIVTTDSIPGKEIIEVKGLVRGSTVRSTNIGKDIGASFKNLVGGELTGYNEMLTEARQIAIGRMVEDAELRGKCDCWNAFNVIISDGRAAEMVAYGTAVVIK